MSLGPHYENVNNADFSMYFNGALVFYYDTERRLGCMYSLYVNEGGSRRAHASTHTLIQPTPRGPFEKEINVMGRDLFLEPHYRIHRIPVEYIPCAGHLVRMTVEPQDRRAFKGTSLNYAVFFEPVHRAGQHMLSPDERIFLRTDQAQARYVRGSANLTQGIEDVLNIGAPRCMRGLISEADMRDTVRRQMNEMFDGERNLVVPDFTTAVVRMDFPCPERPGYNSYGLVLYRGNVLGTVTREESSKNTSFHFIGRTLSDDSPEILALHKVGTTDVTTRLFADSVGWSVWTPPPPEEPEMPQVIFYDESTEMEEEEDYDPDWDGDEDEENP